MNKTNLSILIILAVVLVGGALWYFWSAKGVQAPEATPEEASESEDVAPPQEEAKEPSLSVPVIPRPFQVVTYTNEGFAPSPITVGKGNKVVFENKSSAPFWPASAKHPIHAVYPKKSPNDCAGSSFDACKAIPPGEEWEFTFNAVGEWAYHDHLNPTNFAKIIVQ